MKKIKSPWNFEQPEYDDRSGCYVNAGTSYGVGKTQPVGKMSASSKDAVPKGKYMGLSETEVPPVKLTVEIK